MPEITPRKGFALIGAAALVLVATSVVMTEALELAPCPLCIFQRMLYLLLAPLAVVAVLWPGGLRWSGSAILLTSLGGLATALYQTWLQLHPADAFTCGPADPGPIETLVNWAGTHVPSLFFAWGECSSTEWELFGLSIANWSAVAFFGFAALSTVLLVKAKRSG